MGNYRLVELLDKAVQKVLFGIDLERVGVNVSGGLDSSTVCCLAKRWHPDITTFTGWYDEPGFDERRYAQMAAAGTGWCTIQITAQDFVDNFFGMMAAFTPPFQGPGMFGQYMVAKWIAENTDV